MSKMLMACFISRCMIEFQIERFELSEEEAAELFRLRRLANHCYRKVGQLLVSRQTIR
jgi:hypothetical protein